jgi:hypothetical protein
LFTETSGRIFAEDRKEQEMNEMLHIPPTEDIIWDFFVGKLVVFAIVIIIAIVSYSFGFNRSRKVYVPLGIKTITCYQCVKSQTDSSPDVGAYGKIADHGKPLGRFFANNTLPKGTKIIIPSISGSTVWTLMDKMNKRYSGDYIDLLISKNAVSLGCRKAEIFIVYGTTQKAEAPKVK